MRRPLQLAALALTLTFANPSAAQTLVANDTAIGLRGAVSQSNATGVFAGVRSNAKVKQLLAKANSEARVTVSPDPGRGFYTDYVLRYSRGGINSDLGVRTAIIPLVGNSPIGVSSALMVSYYTSSPQLVIPRLLVRRDPNNWHVTEFSYRKDGVVTEMAARHGDALVRSSLKILEERGHPAHASLRGILDATASRGIHVYEGMRSIYDVRSRPVGQGELLVTTGIFTAANAEEEYQNGYVSGTLDSTFKPARTDSPAVAAAKKLAKDLLKSLLEELGGELIKWIKRLFDFDFGF